MMKHPVVNITRRKQGVVPKNFCKDRLMRLKIGKKITNIAKGNSPSNR